MRTEPDFLNTLAELQGGLVAEIASKAMADVAMATAECGDSRRKGKIMVTIEMIAGKQQGIMEIRHTVFYKHPTARGTKTEDLSDEQIMYVNNKGALASAPDSQMNFEFTEVEND